MKLVIAGSRSINVDIEVLIKSFYPYLQEPIKEVVSGTARGIDTCGEKFALKMNIPIKKFPADWIGFGNSAGVIRNKQMAEYGDALLLIWDGHSNGSANMKNNMMKVNKPIYEIIIQSKTFNIKEEL